MTLSFGIALAPAARAQQGGDEDLPAVQLSGAGVALLKLAVPQAPKATPEAGEILSKDMDITGLFQVLDPGVVPRAASVRRVELLVGAVVAGGRPGGRQDEGAGGELEGRVYVVARGDTRGAVQELSRR